MKGLQTLPSVSGATAALRCLEGHGVGLMEWGLAFTSGSSQAPEHSL